MNTLDRILSLLVQKKITQKQFLSTIGLNETALSDWKSGRSKSYIKYIPQIAAALHTTTSYLLGETDDPSPPGGVKSAPSVKEGGAALQRALVDMGYVSEGEELSDAQIRSLVEFAVRNREFILARAKEIEESQQGK